MKKVCMMLAASLSLISVAGCGNSDSKGERKTKDGKTIVEVSTLGSTESLKQAEKLYEQKNPKIDIQIKGAFLENESKTGGSKTEGSQKDETSAEKIISKVNTEFLAGRGSDVIVLDGLPADKYGKKGLLTDLSEMIEQDKSFDENQYFDKVLDNSKTNEKLYGIPLYFWLSGLLGDDKAIQQSGVKVNDKEWTWSEFTSIGKELASKGTHTHVIGNTPPEQMLQFLVQDHYNELVDKASGKAKFQSDLFVQMLEDVKKMYDEKLATADEVNLGEAYFVRLPMIMSIEDYFSTGAVLGITGTKIYQKPHLAGQKKGVAFTPNTTVGINEKSPVKKEAWNFLKFLMSDEVQSKGNGFPINKAVYEQQIKTLKEKKGIEGPDGTLINVTESDIQGLEKMVAEISVQSPQSTKIESIIAEESKSYFSGQKSAKDVAALIQNRVTTYINE
ncbi:ABC transporter substrate-binding protein [Bacillus toyonensis]|uniref:ABC transporter substrate-binding protein n=1 Tax=Bacillus toyonensis TaxID=155322 RepID=UPI0009B20FB6|nr:ABC transporter substrate-binding protein [Bacillus toyonensis]OQD25619.1 putative ABC transporter substrate-binding protein YesO [Bacillus toyonensis]PED97445.1 carbohydrate ABC transporter substrate-binding protein [Bacillus toyonensis]PEE20487.1 carbohydrate ABC transporter substrate-binding protein [Bacillus toyonensis]PHC12458.1 carbohydrate ABC transporter substrate-binding protein [Bacillus toyonensis]PHD35000.1 carbohydrate ABC transporter substrate-binding protein [Bacillus toyonen